ncbi:MAG: hypothetical protein NC253_03045 [Ruminococcus sp.]|nr:hypothetical protein [Ruminococcus sp.]MCM1380372.1 hypothetical protein [Muribaculaceae bacterium]MCM1478318.1 hypothetical protein [Muribaculaceae bacterium]
MPRSYATPWVKNEARQAEEARERERRKLSLFTEPSKYCIAHGIQLNVNNTVINAFYEDTIRRRKLGHPPFGDREECPQRQAWEACLWTFLRKQFMRHDSETAKLIPIRLFRDKHMSEVLFGWRLEFFEMFINNTLDVPEALKKFAAEEEKIDYKNCKEYRLVNSDIYRK